MDFPSLPALSQVPYPPSRMLPALQIAGLGDAGVQYHNHHHVDL